MEQTHGKVILMDLMLIPVSLLLLITTLLNEGLTSKERVPDLLNIIFYSQQMSIGHTKFCEL